MEQEFNLWFGSGLWVILFTLTLGDRDQVLHRRHMPLVPPVFALGLILQAVAPSLAALPELPSPVPPACLLIQYPDRLWDFYKAIKHK